MTQNPTSKELCGGIEYDLLPHGQRAFPRGFHDGAHTLVSQDFRAVRAAAVENLQIRSANTDEREGDDQSSGLWRLRWNARNMKNIAPSSQRLVIAN